MTHFLLNFFLNNVAIPVPVGSTNNILPLGYKESKKNKINRTREYVISFILSS